MTLVLVGAIPRHEDIGEAFRRLARDFPQAKLKILGHYPDRDQLNVFTGGSAQIEILKARPYLVTPGTISRAMALALSSLCEGMCRVLITRKVELTLRGYA
jgi:hypothetical protein